VVVDGRVGSGPGGFWTNLTEPPQDLGRCFDTIQSPPSAKAVFGAEGARYEFGDPASQRRTDLVHRNGQYDFDLSARAYGAKKPFTTSSLSNADLTRWAPFVLGKIKQYTLDLPGVQPPIVGLRGTLHNNTLTFALPPFTIPIRKIVRGTINKQS
jgi:hypothetical protein